MSAPIDLSTREKLLACLDWLIDGGGIIPCAKGRLALYEAIRRELDIDDCGAVVSEEVDSVT